MGDKVAPWLAERYLAKTAVSSQLSQTTKPADRPDNLFEPAPGDPGAHGPYDDRAHRYSIQLWATKHRRGLLGGLAGAALAVAGAAYAG